MYKKVFWSNRIESDNGVTIELFYSGIITYAKYTDSNGQFAIQWEMSTSKVDKILLFVDDVCLWDESFYVIDKLPADIRKNKLHELGENFQYRTSIDKIYRRQIISNIKEALESVRKQSVIIIVDNEI